MDSRGRGGKKRKGEEGSSSDKMEPVPKKGKGVGVAAASARRFENRDLPLLGLVGLPDNVRSQVPEFQPIGTRKRLQSVIEMVKSI